MSDCVVRFDNVSKRFRLGQHHDSLRDLLAGMGRKLFRRSAAKPANEVLWALREVSFEVEAGGALGVIGPNGAGKSTALRLLARILRPDGGQIEVRGRLAALIEVGAGFHGDLTGRENVFLNGAILGMTRREIRRKLDDIVAFAGLERFLDMPVKRYSSGMYARLGFSIAAHVDPEVLLVDEVLSVGDAVFRLRCLERMRQLVEAGTALVFVTHNLDQMQSICQNALVLSAGRTAFAGSAREAVRHYMDAMSQSYIDTGTDLSGGSAKQTRAELVSLQLHNRSNQQIVWVGPDEPVRITAQFRLHEPIRQLVAECNMRADLQQNLLSFNSGRMGRSFELAAGVHTLTLEMPCLPVAGGQYFWNFRLWDMERGTTELDTPWVLPMVVDDGGRATGRLALPHDWRLSEATGRDDGGDDSSSQAEAAIEVTPVSSGVAS
jgi:ABC-type polysaccharide/polyol phosphate transport system ATPase subunit